MFRPAVRCRLEIVTAAGARVFTSSGALLRSYMAVGQGAALVDNRAEIVTGPAAGRPLVNIHHGTTLANLESFDAFDPTFTGGVYVG